MTPAERLAASNPRQRPQRNSPARERLGVWKCRIRERRERLGLSMRAVAEAVGLSMSSMSVIENGGDPMLLTARKLTAFFGCRTETLWPRLTEKGETK